MRLLTACVILLISMVLLQAQDNPDQKVVSAPSDEELAARKRMQELLHHPTFISLRLRSSPRDVPPESATDTPAPYHVKDYMGFQLFITQNSSETMRLGITSSHYDYRPELMKDGELVSYSENAATRVDRAENYPYSGSVMAITLKPGEENRLALVNLEDWYDPLAPGRYQLTVRKQFTWQGDWVISSPVYFEVVPKPVPAPIPDGVTLELVPDGLNQKGKMYRLRADTVVRVLTENKSDKVVKVNTVDFFYAIRPQLSRDGILIAHRPDVAELVTSGERDPRLIQLQEDLFLQPGSRTGLTYLRLGEWYGPLLPGSYRLTVRQRFEIDGPWTTESAPLLFEITASKRN